VWLQGIVRLVEEHSCVIDDGSGVMLVRLLHVPPQRVKELENGSYVMVVGQMQFQRTDPREFELVAHNLIDLSFDPNRMPLWWLEVMHASLSSEV